MAYKKLTTGAVAIAGLLFISSLALAHWPGKGERWGGGMGSGLGMHYFSALDLTKEQRSEFNRLRFEFLNETAEFRGKVVASRTELRALIANPEAKTEEISAKKREILKIRTELAEKHIDHQAKMRAVLTKEQLSQMGNRSPGRGYGHGRMQGRGWGRGMGMGMGRGGGYGPNCPNW